MKRGIYILILVLGIVACEEIYRPDIDQVDNLLVVEAMVRTDKTENTIHLYRSKGFYDESYIYPKVTGAKVYLIDDSGSSTQCIETSSGDYTLYETISPNAEYQLKIELDGDEYISDFQQVPTEPTLDEVYAERAYKVFEQGTINSSEDIVNEYGVQVYADISENGNVSHYRFYGRKVIQYLDSYDTIVEGFPMTLPIYIWNSVYPTGTFNVAGPPEYSMSNDVKKHPLEFFKNDYKEFMPDTMSFQGWIYLIDEFGINENSYNYYKDINQQLNADGRIFDPVYVQLQGNIRCETDPDKVVLGNFEITSYTESRYFLTYSKFKDDFQLKRIPYFFEIPLKGYEKNNRPDFWESLNKIYPDE